MRARAECQAPVSQFTSISVPVHSAGKHTAMTMSLMNLPHKFVGATGFPLDRWCCFCWNKNLDCEQHFYFGLQRRNLFGGLLAWYIPPTVCNHWVWVGSAKFLSWSQILQKLIEFWRSIRTKKTEWKIFKLIVGNRIIGTACVDAYSAAWALQHGLGNQPSERGAPPFCNNWCLCRKFSLCRFFSTHHNREIHGIMEGTLLEEATPHRAQKFLGTSWCHAAVVTWRHTCPIVDSKLARLFPLFIRCATVLPADFYRPSNSVRCVEIGLHLFTRRRPSRVSSLLLFDLSYRWTPCSSFTESKLANHAHQNVIACVYNAFLGRAWWSRNGLMASCTCRCCHCAAAGPSWPLTTTLTLDPFPTLTWPDNVMGGCHMMGRARPLCWRGVLVFVLFFFFFNQILASRRVRVKCGDAYCCAHGKSSFFSERLGCLF